VAGLDDTAEIIDIQLATQLRRFDKNGMYRDGVRHAPVVYDHVPRGLLPFFYALDIVAKKHTLEIRYGGWICRYESDGEIADLNCTAENRNGRYRAFAATGWDTLCVKINIFKEQICPV
jgi:hypothetical protein